MTQPEAPGNFYRAAPELRALCRQALGRDETAVLEPALEDYGALCAGPFDREAMMADRFRPPTLVAWDAQGDPANEVLLHPGFAETLRRSCEAGIIAANYRDDVLGRRVPYTATYAMAYLLAHADHGARCILSVTAGNALALSLFAPEPLRRRYLSPMLSTGEYPIATGGTFFTERQGGSDLGANTTTARLENDVWRLYGEKWFCSNAGADVALVTAHQEGGPPGVKGLSLYLMPRVLEDGSLNAYRIRRLKDKMGTVTVPTGEVELDGAVAYLVGGPGDGIRQAMESINYSRLSVAMGSLGLLHRAVLEARSHARQRTAFGRRVDEFPMIRETLLDLAAQHAAALALAFRALHSFDQVYFYGEGDRLLMRLLTHLAKYRASEIGAEGAVRAMQVVGGNAYVHESVLSRVVRDALANPIWEGTGNIQAVQAVRLMGDRGAHLPLLEEMRETLHRVASPSLAEERERLQRELGPLEEAVGRVLGRDDLREAHARRLLDYLCDVLSAVQLLGLADASHEGAERVATLVRWHLRRSLEAAPRREPGFWEVDPTPAWEETLAQDDR